MLGLKGVIRYGLSSRKIEPDEEENIPGREKRERDQRLQDRNWCLVSKDQKEGQSDGCRVDEGGCGRRNGRKGRRIHDSP